MINQEKFRKEYDNICLSDAEKKELTVSVISGKRKSEAEASLFIWEFLYGNGILFIFAVHKLYIIFH